MENNNTKEEGITLSDIIRVLWKNAILIAIITAVVTIAGAIYTFAIAKPTYKATADVIVAVSTSTTDTVTNISSTETLRITQTVAETVTKDIVAKEVAEKNNVEASYIKSGTTTNASTSSYIVTITFVDKDKDLCVTIVNDLAQTVTDKFNNDDTLKKYNARLSQITTPEKSTYNSPNKKLYMIVSVLLGLVLACAVVFLKEFMSNKFKTKEEIERVLGLNVIGLMPDHKENEKEDSNKFPESIQEFEPYNKLISSIEYFNMGKTFKTLMFTSSVTNELKSTTVSNVGYTLVNNEKKVCIVDLDTRKPRIHKIFGVKRALGVIDFIKGDAKLEEIIKTTDKGVDIITAGLDIVNPIVLLKNEKLFQMIDELKEKYDYVLIDTPPVAGLTDAVLIAPNVDGIIFNVAMNQVKKKQSKESVRTLASTGANIIGINVTKAQLTKNEYYSYYYYYGNPATVKDDEN